MSLADKTVVITGAAQGIGYAAASLSVDLGANVVLCDLDRVRLDEARHMLGEDRVETVCGNVSEPGFSDAAVAAAVGRFGKVDGLVNSAGIVRAAMAEKMSLDDWKLVLDVHLTGSFLFLQSVGRHMLDRARDGDASPGAIVNISSNAGVQGTMGQINYGTAKAGILGTTMSAAREWAKYGIRVNAVAFGVVETQMTETVRGEKFHERTLAKIPMGRFSSPEESVYPICFLLSDAAAYITGQRLSSNGGSQMSM
jgi:3-oxoacyl-[acyl-carrier protein] reductase